MGAKKKLQWILLVLGAVIVTVGLAILVANLTSQKPANDCSKVSGQIHKVVIKNNKVQPFVTDGTLCDKLTITNLDDRDRLMAFGEHEHHEAYDGITEVLLPKGKSFTVTMNKTGSYIFHDHLDDSVKGDFTVSPRP